jgi:biopolymer transport protein ExbD
MAFNLSSTPVTASINMTPMIDILLVLLIIFMVVAPANPVGLPAAIPTPAPDTASAPENPIVVEVAKDGQIRINTQPVDQKDLAAAFSRIFSSRADRTLFLRGDRDLEFASVANVIDIARGAGVDRTALLTGK